MGAGVVFSWSWGAPKKLTTFSFGIRRGPNDHGVAYTPGVGIEDPPNGLVLRVLLGKALIPRLCHHVGCDHNGNRDNEGREDPACFAAHLANSAGVGNH